MVLQGGGASSDMLGWRRRKRQRKGERKSTGERERERDRMLRGDNEIKTKKRWVSKIKIKFIRYQAVGLFAGTPGSNN